MTGSMNGQQIYDNFANGEGPARLMGASDYLEQIEREYTQRVQQITDLAASMEEGWTGDAAGAAQRGAGPLAVAHDGASQEMATGKDLLRDQTDSFMQARWDVVPVPPEPAHPSTLKQIVTLGSAQSDYEKGKQKSQEAADHNVAVMNQWTTVSSYNGSMMPSEYPQIDPNAMNISQAEPTKPGGVDYPGGGGVKPPGGRSGGNSGGSDSGGGTGGRAPGGGQTSGNQPPGGPAPGTPKPHDGTTPGGWTPPGSAVKPGGPFKPGQGVSGSQGDGSEAGFVSGIGAALSGGTPGTGAGSGSGGGRMSGAGAGAGSGSGTGNAGERLTGGRGSGAGAVGGAGEPGVRGGAAGAKGAGRPGGMGGGGMGQGAKGAGGEDEEHQRKFVLDDDEHFQLTDDGERVVDPRTGMVPVAPVIGE